MPKNNTNPPVAKKDKSGNLICSAKGLKNLYSDTYFNDRLVHNEIQKDLEDLQKQKEDLFFERLEEAKKCKSKP